MAMEVFSFSDNSTSKFERVGGDEGLFFEVIDWQMFSCQETF